MKAYLGRVFDDMMGWVNDELSKTNDKGRAIVQERQRQSAQDWLAKAVTLDINQG